MKRKQICIAALLLALSLAGCSPGGADVSSERQLYLGSGSVGGAFFTVAAGLGSVINAHTPDLKISAQSTSGTEENFNSFLNGEIELAMVTAENAYIASRKAGEGSAAVQADPLYGARQDLVCLVNLECVLATVVTRENSEFTSYQDILEPGVKIGIGTPGASAYDAFLTLTRKSGVDPDGLKTYMAGHQQMAEALKDGNTDVFVNLVQGPSAPNASIAELSTSTKLKFLPIEETLRTNICADYPFYQKAELPVGWVDDISEPVPTLSFGMTVLVDAELPNELVYEMTKAMFEHLDELTQVSVTFSTWTKETAASGIPCQLHPGALKYYEENGFTISYLP